MTGFFNKQETESKTRPDGKILSCISCGGYKNCKSPKMKPQGNFGKRIMILGSSPTEQDDKYNLYFQSKAGKLLKRTFENHGIDLLKDCLLINSCLCRVTDEDAEDRDPTNYEIDCCRKTVLKTIETHKPKLIFLLGHSAVYSLIGHRWKRDLGGIDKWRGWRIPDQDYKAWLCPIFEPDQVERAKGAEVQSIWDLDIKEALLKLKEKFPLYQEPRIEYLTDDLLPVLNTYRQGEIAFDFETTGLKPHAEGHRIICASVATSTDHVYSFMIPERKRDVQPFKDLLSNERIGKIAQNMKFEDTWSIVRLGNTEVKNWKWDTMQATHLLDNRPGVTGLKFQVYVQFGKVDYSSDIEPYLKAKEEKNSNSLNRIDELLKLPGGKEKLLKYCAYDSIFEYRLAKLQRSVIELPF